MPSRKYRGQTFGIAAGRLDLPADSLEDLLEFQEFDAIELPAACFLEPKREFLRKARSGPRRSISAGAILDRDTTTAVPFSERHMQDKFRTEAEQILEKLCKQKVKTATLEADMERILAEPKAEEAFLRIVRGLGPVLERTNMTLLIPWRIPSPDPHPMIRFLQKTLLPRIKVRLDVHPHEMNPGDDLRAACGALSFETRSLVFVYDADSGNRILARHPEVWMEHLNRYGFEGPFLLCPNSTRRRMLIPETELYGKLISGLRNE